MADCEYNRLPSSVPVGNWIELSCALIWGYSSIDNSVKRIFDKLKLKDRYVNSDWNLIKDYEIVIQRKGC